ncbi:Sphingolipid C4-hydroxylase sur2 [Microbotryomycetes sp. JL221]|nr:Sphingolipid C4-hydroxylase sur2 [Microbotryomycetes sp. JL221]
MDAASAGWQSLTDLIKHSWSPLTTPMDRIVTLTNASLPLASLTDAGGSALAYTSSLPLNEYPWYHVARPSIIQGIEDRYLSLITPVAVYWIYSLWFHLLDSLHWPSLEKHKIHEPKEVTTKNRVTVPQVIKAVIVQHTIQTAIGYLWIEQDNPLTGPFRNHRNDLDTYESRITSVLSLVLGGTGRHLAREHGPSVARWLYWWGVPVAQLLLAAVLLDGWQYFWHRYFHVNKFLYRHIHSIHHRLYVPYAFGALYNHPIEGFVLDTLGAGVAQICAGLTTRQAILFFGISSAKTVDDHCGYNFPWDPFQFLFFNDVDYHDIHHQIAGLKKNFSQPFFIHFDYLFGTRMTRQEFEDKRNKRIHKGIVPSNKVNGPNELAAPPTSKQKGPAIKQD